MLFACLFAIMVLSDSPITRLSSFHYFLSPAVVESPTALNGASRLPCGRHQYMRRVSDSGEPGSHSHNAAVRVAFPITQQGRRSQSWFRSSIPSLYLPLSTLNRCPYEQQPMTRGSGGVLTLSR